MFKVLETNNKKYELYNVISFSDSSLINEIQVYLRIQQAINSSLTYYYRLKPDANISATFDFEFKSIYNSKKNAIETRLKNYFPSFKKVNNELAEKMSKLYVFDSFDFINEFKNDLDQKRTFRKIIKNGLLALKNEVLNPENNLKLNYFSDVFDTNNVKDLFLFDDEFKTLIDKVSNLKTNEILDWFLDCEDKLKNCFVSVDQFVFRHNDFSNLDDIFNMNFSNKTNDNQMLSFGKSKNELWTEIKSKLNRNIVDTHISVCNCSDLLLFEFSSRFYSWITRYLAMKIIREKYNLIYSPLTKEIFIGEIVLENTISNTNVQLYKVALGELLSELDDLSHSEEIFNKFKANIIDEINNCILENTFFEIYSMFNPQFYDFDYNILLDRISNYNVNDLLGFENRGTVYIKGSENGL